MTESPPPPPPKKKKSVFQRYQKARGLIWSYWSDEAVLIYRRSAHGKDRVRVFSVELFLFVREVVREFFRVQGSVRATSLAYTTLLSLIPLLVAFSKVLRTYFASIFPDLKSQVDSFLNVVLPYRSSQISYHLARFAENAEAASTFGALVFLVISFRLFMAVEDTVNQIWKVRDSRGYRQKLVAFTMLFFWGPLLIGLSFTTTAGLEKIPFLRRFVENAFVLAAVPVLVLFIAFTMLFWLVPSTHVKIKSAAFGALLTSIAFQSVRFGFGLYSDHLFAGSMNLIYGTLGLLIVFLFALELMWVVILVGVESSYVFQNLHGILRASEKQLEEDPRLNLYFALRALIEVSRRFETREDAPSSYRLAESFSATDKQMVTVLRKLEDAQLVKEIGGDWAGFVPGCDPDRIQVAEVVRVMEGGGHSIPNVENQDDAMREIAGLFERLDLATTTALERKTVGQLVRTIYHPREVRVEEDDEPKPGWLARRLSFWKGE